MGMRVKHCLISGLKLNFKNGKSIANHNQFLECWLALNIEFLLGKENQGLSHLSNILMLREKIKDFFGHTDQEICCLGEMVHPQ